MNAQQELDRHALVMAVWAPAALVAAMTLSKGVSDGGALWIAAGFAALIAGFVAHVIVNSVLKTGFARGEVALGLVCFAAGLIALVLVMLLAPSDLRGRILLPMGLGFAALVVAVVVYLLIAFGPRKAFEKFDVIRDNNLRPASRLPHRGGRR